MTEKPNPTNPLESDDNIFFEEWQACLRSHYAYVLQNQDDVTEPTLRQVLQRTGLSEDDLEALRAAVLQNVGTIDITPVEQLRELDDVEVEEEQEEGADDTGDDDWPQANTPPESEAITSAEEPNTIDEDLAADDDAAPEDDAENDQETDDADQFEEDAFEEPDDDPPPSTQQLSLF